MKCPSCKAVVSDDSQFCSKCGASLKGAAQTRTIQSPATLFNKGQLIAGKYRIIQKIGEGGMGVVYKAQDTKLDRPVALKFLPSEMTRDPPSKKRFIQEAKAAAALSHPNITVVYEIGEDERQTFIAMEFIEGQTLREKIESGPLEIEEAVEIASQVAEGLKEAHDRGIIHRDIKPANIMLTGRGQAKIMDFGLAKLSWGADLTKPATVMGTAAYMSPEQARGEPVDHRTDIWSLGAMLYEMLAGEKPFQKSHDQALIHSILNDELWKISDVRSDVPDHLEEAIHKALTKDANRRFQTAAEMLRELGKRHPMVFPMAKKSILVLPFENLSPDPDQEYFCDGMTEEIITDLSHIHELLVISRSSSMTFKNTKKKIRDIAKDVNVQYVLEGSVRKAGNNLRITGQLIDASNDVHIWAEKYDGCLDDVFNIQERVSRSIVEALKLRITPYEKKQIAARSIENVQAYEHYLRAMGEMQLASEGSAERALEELQEGLKIAGDNVLFFAGIGLAYCNLYEIGAKATEDTLAKAEEYAFKVLWLEPNSALSYSLLGRIERFRGSALKALKYFSRALDIDPNDLQALFWSGLGYFWHVGRPEVAKAILEKLINIDPLSQLNHLIIGIQNAWTGEYDKAIGSFKHILESEPNNTLAHFWTAYVLLWKKQYDEAFNLIDSLAIKESTEQMHPLFTGWLLFLKHGLQGEKSKALMFLNDDVRNFFWNDPDLPFYGAGAFALIDEKDEAIRWLEHSINRGFINYPIISKTDPFLENIRSEPRFKKLMERVKHEWENFKV